MDTLFRPKPELTLVPTAGGTPNIKLSTSFETIWVALGEVA